MDRIKINIPALIGSIQNLDVAMFRWMMNRRHLYLWARLCRLVSRTADGFFYPFLGLALWFFGGVQGQLFASTLSLGFLFERPLYLILKKGLKRNRPAEALPDFKSFIIPSDQFSFPSGHTSGAFATATALAMFFPDTIPIVYGWAAMVGVSRVTLGVHFPTDTLVGAAMGTLISLFTGYWITQ